MRKTIVVVSGLVLGAAMVWVLFRHTDWGEVLESPTAVSLKDAFTEIGDRFEKQHTNVQIVFNFSGSNLLQKQIESGAPVDVFASAAEKHLKRLVQKGLIDENTRRDFAANRIVLIVPKSVDIREKSFDYLKSKHCGKIAVGAPDVPVRIYAEEMLRHLNFWDAIEDKLVFGQHARQVLDYVMRNEVDAGFVYSTDAALVQDKVTILARAESSWHSQIVYPIAVLKSTPHKEEAKKFVEFIVNSVSQEILKKYGFIPVKN